MAIVVKAKKKDSLNDLIRRFKKMTIARNIVQNAKDRRYYQKPSKKKAIKVSQKKRLIKRMRSLKKMKNTSPGSIKRILEKINS